MRECRLITSPILIEPCDDSVTVFGNHLVELFFGSTYPILLIVDGFCVGAYFVAKIEVTIA